MELKNRITLLRLMAIHNVDQRTLAQEAGWSTHSYLGQLLRGQKKTLKVEPAIRIAKFFNDLDPDHSIGVDDLFVARGTTKSGSQNHTQGSR